MNMRTRYLASTLALLAVGLGFGVSQWRPKPPPARPARAASTPVRLSLPPTAREILDRAQELQLSRDQVIRLNALDQRWKAETANLEAAIRDASAEFDRFMSEARSGRGASLEEVQRHSADLRALSAELRERRNIHSARAVEILSGPQQERLRS